jgi:hypothetical protein
MGKTLLYFVQKAFFCQIFLKLKHWSLVHNFLRIRDQRWNFSKYSLKEKMASLTSNAAIVQHAQL